MQTSRDNEQRRGLMVAMDVEGWMDGQTDE